MPYGEPWRDSRRMAHHEFSATAVKRFRASEAKATRYFLRNMHRHPAKMMDNLRQYVTPLPRASLSSFSFWLLASQYPYPHPYPYPCMKHVRCD